MPLEILYFQGINDWCAGMVNSHEPAQRFLLVAPTALCVRNERTPDSIHDSYILQRAAGSCMTLKCGVRFSDGWQFFFSADHSRRFRETAPFDPIENLRAASPQSRTRA